MASSSNANVPEGSAMKRAAVEAVGLNAFDGAGPEPEAVFCEVDDFGCERIKR
jgi:hypothetical protein